MADKACHVFGSATQVGLTQALDLTGTHWGGVMNPWKIIGWIVLVCLVLMLGFCGLVLYGIGSSTNSDSIQSSTSPSRAAPTYSVKIVSVECRDNHGRNRADITVTNTGSTSIPYTKVFVQFQDRSGAVLSAQDSYLRPHDIPPGATASATVYSSGGGASTCGVVAIQDGDGNAVQVQ
jgi:hypothetical protein